MLNVIIISWKLASIVISQKHLSAKMRCFASLVWWVLHPSAAIASALFHITRCTDKCMHAHKHTQIASRKLHHFPAVVWKLHLSPTVTPITPWVSFFFSPSPLTPSFAFPHYFRLFPPLYSALNCQAWIALWTAWGGQASRRCVWMHESLCYHHLFSFSSPSDAVRSQTRYHSPAIPPNPPTGSHNTTLRNWNKRIKTKVNKMVAFQTLAPLPYKTNPMILFVP